MVICFLMNGELPGMAPNCGERFPIMTKRSVLATSLVYCRARDPYLSLWPIKLQVRARLKLNTLVTALIFHHYNLCNIIHQLFLLHVTNLQDVSVSLFAKNNSRIKLSYHGTNKKRQY